MFVPGKLFHPSLTKNLTHYENSYVTDIISFITLPPGVKVIKSFTTVIYECSE
jgi:hypothetical protein